MNLTSSEYKEIARDALRGKRFKSTIAFMLAVFLGAFFTSTYFMCQFATVMGVSVRLFEREPHSFLILLVIGIVLAIFYFFMDGFFKFSIHHLCINSTSDVFNVIVE